MLQICDKNSNNQSLSAGQSWILLILPGQGRLLHCPAGQHRGESMHALETPIGGGLRIGFTESMLPSDKEHMEAIAAMSDKLGVSTSDVAAVFRSELDRLRAGARIKDFLIVLALGKTRTLLRARSGRVAAH
jgi:hypothetical protein